MFDYSFINYLNIVCFDVGCFYLEYKRYTPMAHLRKGVLLLYL